MPDIHIPELSDVDMAFGTTQGLPAYDRIPVEFRDSRTQWNNLVSKIFFTGVKGLQFTAHPGVDGNAAYKHVRALLASWEPKHEHKEAGVAYLMSQYFKSATWDGGSAS
ncbi:hypothetical protein G6F57_015579 [Rhizopus arrhizus]|nr:hypothetical protein G6F57_015579 [Rhizopus arrhizus]